VIGPGVGFKRVFAGLLALCLVAGLVPATEAAKRKPRRKPAVIRVGIHDEEVATLTSQPFRALKIKRVRYMVRYDVAFDPQAAAQLDEWLRVAGQYKVEPLITFNKPPGMSCPGPACRAPSVSAYKNAFLSFRRRWPNLKVVTVWNEANHRSQPTFKNPKRAAQYYNVVRGYCRGCKIVAADVLDDYNMQKWVRSFRRYAKKPKIWGLHNYRDCNPRKGQVYGGTRRYLKATKRGEVWFTETGGIVYFKLPEGGVLFKRNMGRAQFALRRMFALARKYRKRVKRVYIYNWRESPYDNRFDAGLVDKFGNPRPTYQTVATGLRTKLFAP
jgi:hypothetical protein